MGRITEFIAYLILVASLVAICLIIEDHDIEISNIQDLIRAEVKAEMDRRYRNVPRISVEKVYTLHATGQDILIETENKK